jgi:hypothetical protein
VVQALLEHVIHPSAVRDSDAFARAARILSERVTEQQLRERLEVTPAQPVANIAAALPSLAELKAMSETLWERLATIGSAASTLRFDPLLLSSLVPD